MASDLDIISNTALEVSEIMFSDVIKHTASTRIDAEYFQKKYIAQDQRLASKPLKKLIDLVNKIDVGHVGSMVDYYTEIGIPLFQTKNVQTFFLKEEGVTRVDVNFHNSLKKSQVKYEDILIARSGSFGKASIYLEKEQANSADIIIIEANRSLIDPYYLTAYLNSFYGVNQMIRFASGGLQGHINLTILEELLIPVLNFSFQDAIQELVSEAYKLKYTADNSYAEAEKMLLDITGTDTDNFNNKPTNIKSFSDSFEISGRLDAEYYLPKYESLVQHIKANKYKTLKDLVTIKKSIEPGSAHYSEQGIPFLRVSDFNKFGIYDPNKKLSHEFANDNADLINDLKLKKGNILFSKDGSVGNAFLLRKDEDMITSGAILQLSIINPKAILPEYLTLVLNSALVQMQAERDAGGSIILHWRISEIENVLIPILDISIQEEIVSLVEKSFALKHKSEEILEIVKLAIELAIDKNEQEALSFIKSQFN